MYIKYITYFLCGPKQLCPRQAKMLDTHDTVFLEKELFVKLPLVTFCIGVFFFLTGHLLVFWKKIFVLNLINSVILPTHMLVYCFLVDYLTSILNTYTFVS